MKIHKISLPYVDNLKAILITVLINLIIVFIFNWPGGVTYMGALFDSLFCVVITTVIDIIIVFLSMKKLRKTGSMPLHVPVSRFMQRLPKNPFGLGAVFILMFGIITIGLNAVILWFFGMSNMAFVPWMVYKLVYSTILSIKITEYAIFRYVQPDWAISSGEEPGPEEPPDTKPVKNPLPKISLFKELYGGITMNIAMMILIGTALGGVVLSQGDVVVIYPTTIQTIPISGLIFGLITGILVTRGVMKEIDSIILSSADDGGELPEPDRRFTWMPVRKPLLMILVCVVVMLFSAVILWAIMLLFGMSVMNFYQFVIFITIYAIIVCKPVSYVLIHRCMQPDYIMYVIKKKGAKSVS